MAVCVDFSLNPIMGNAAQANASTASQDFAHCYAQAVTEDLLPVTENPAGEESTEVDSAKKMSPEEEAALLILFLFSQHMRGVQPTPDMSPDEGAAQEHPSDTASPLAAEKNPTELSALAEDALAEDLEQMANRPPDAPAKAKGGHAEHTATQHVDKAADAMPTNPQSEIQADEPTRGLPVIQDDSTAASSSAPRPLHSLDATSSSARQAVAPAAEAANAALPLRSGQFSEMLGQRVMWLSSQNLQSAQFQLDPKELGTLKVRVTLSGGLAEVQLASGQAEVRAVLEGHLPRLQTMLEAEGLPTARLAVFDSSLAQGKEQGGRQSRSQPKSPASLRNEESASIPPAISQTLIDYYA